MVQRPDAAWRRGIGGDKEANKHADWPLWSVAAPTGAMRGEVLQRVEVAEQSSARSATVVSMYSCGSTAPSP